MKKKKELQLKLLDLDIENIKILDSLAFREYDERCMTEEYLNKLKNPVIKEYLSNEKFLSLCKYLTDEIKIEYLFDENFLNKIQRIVNFDDEIFTLFNYLELCYDVQKTLLDILCIDKISNKKKEIIKKDDFNYLIYSLNSVNQIKLLNADVKKIEVLLSICNAQGFKLLEYFSFLDDLDLNDYKEYSSDRDDQKIKNVFEEHKNCLGYYPENSYDCLAEKIKPLFDMINDGEFSQEKFSLFIDSKYEYIQKLICGCNNSSLILGKNLLNQELNKLLNPAPSFIDFFHESYFSFQRYSSIFDQNILENFLNLCKSKQDCLLFLKFIYIKDDKNFKKIKEKISNVLNNREDTTKESFEEIKDLILKEEKRSETLKFLDYLAANLEPSNNIEITTTRREKILENQF